MSISGALSNALSGLTAASRAAEVVSSNLANAMTDGYGRREVSLSSTVAGYSGGVSVNGITRMVNQPVVNERRQSEAAYTQAERLYGFQVSMEGLIGTPDATQSLASTVADLEAGLIAAASQPSSSTRLAGVADDAKALAQKFNSISGGIQDKRTEADHNISAMVDRMNGLLGQVEDLNKSIVSAQSTGKESVALEDARQLAIDEISNLVPVRQLARDNGGVALYASGGVVLLDGSAVRLEFERSTVVTPGQNLEEGTLSGVTLSSGQVVWGSGKALLDGGAIAAEFAIRDDLAPSAQARLDGIARDLVERFEMAGTDPTRDATTPGLFTDDGAQFDAGQETGLSGRLSVNALVDTEQGGATWRLRDGLGATEPGGVGDARILQNLADALSESRTPDSQNLDPVSGSVHALATGLVSYVGSARLGAEQDMSFASANFSTMREMELADGVDQDSEVQNLMLIEQSFAANARVIETIDGLMDTLLRL